MSNYSKAMFSQLDPNWKNVKMGYSNLTVGSYGCTITSICQMIYDLFKIMVTPKWAAENFSFDEDGKLYWGSVKIALEKLGYKIDFKGRFYNKPSHQLRTEVANNPDKGMLIELYTPEYKWPRHWVYLKNNTILLKPWIQVFDPVPGYYVAKPKWKMIGYAVYEVV